MDTSNSIEFNLETIIAFAKSKGFRYEAMTPVFDRWGERISSQTMIGVELKQHVWYWFEQDSKSYNIVTQKYEYREPYVFFAHRYNQNIGNTIKSFKQGQKARNFITEITNKL